jgi:kynurenine formamidase
MSTISDWKEPERLPTYKELRDRPKPKDGPQLNTWDVFPDKNLGRLMLLTPERVQKAKDLIQTGESIGLDWSIDKPRVKFFDRPPCNHEIKQIAEINGVGVAFDDYLDINTQSSSQWDGFFHFADIESGRFYGGIHGNDLTSENPPRGVAAWSDRGIIARGVFLDIYKWAKESYDPFTKHAITVSDIKACAKEQGVEFRKGDILIIRSGWIKRHDSCDNAELASHQKEPAFAGVQQCEEMKEFLHDNYFAAVAGDAPAFEVCIPPDWWLHEFLLANWGIPIGEFWNLEKLSETCARLGRYEFCLVSKPLNVPTGIGSPPNAIAIF